MAYIYKITNQINGKVYIGKTTEPSINERWKQHKSECHKERVKNRPFYKALNKYGPENFIIEEIEQCDVAILEEREIYWIDIYRSYIGWDDCNGYNATTGGDGKAYCDYDWVYQLWQEGNSQAEISQITSYQIQTIRKILKGKGIAKEEMVQRGKEVSRQKSVKSCAQIDKNTNEPIQFFNSLTDACLKIQQESKYSHSKIKNIGAHISQVCRGKRKTAYGYKWRYI